MCLFRLFSGCKCVLFPSCVCQVCEHHDQIIRFNWQKHIPDFLQEGSGLTDSMSHTQHTHTHLTLTHTHSHTYALACTLTHTHSHLRTTHTRMHAHTHTHSHAHTHTHTHSLTRHTHRSSSEFWVTLLLVWIHRPSVDV